MVPNYSREVTDLTCAWVCECIYRMGRMGFDDRNDGEWKGPYRMGRDGWRKDGVVNSEVRSDWSERGVGWHGI